MITEADKERYRYEQERRLIDRAVKRSVIKALEKLSTPLPSDSRILICLPKTVLMRIKNPYAYRTSYIYRDPIKGTEVMWRIVGDINLEGDPLEHSESEQMLISVLFQTTCGKLIRINN